MTIKIKLILLGLLGLLSSVFIGGLGLWGLNSNVQSVNSLYNDRVVPLRDLKMIADMYAVNIVDTSHKLRNGNINWDEASKNVADAQKLIHDKWQAYLATTLVAEEQALIDLIKPMLVTANKEIARLEGMIRLKDMQALEQFTINQLYPAIDPISDQFAKLIDVQLTVADRDYHQMSDQYQISQWIVILVLLISLLLIVSVASSVIKSVINSTTRMSVAMQEAMKGNFKHQVEVHGHDEITTSVHALNALMRSLDQAISEANHVVGSIATADFSQRMSADYSGDLDRLKQGVNASAESVSFMMSELTNVMKGLQQGNLSIQMDVRVPAEFRHSVDGALSSINHIVVDINQIMQRLNVGNFEARVNADAQGDLLQMKDSVNSTLDTLEQLVDDLVRMAKAQMEGDLTVVSQGNYKGRFKELQDARATSTARIKEVVGLALEASHVVSDAAGQVSQGSSDLSARVQEQASALEETSATMHEMTSAVEANTENATRVAALAHQMQDQSDDGVQVMQQTIEAMKSIQQASNKIADIVSIIDSIAFQTNLLALNAAVEAARAGEHGRGFAVVASEVRALAGKSADAAKDIKGLIEDSVQRIDVGTKLADKSGEMLSNISDSIKDVANMIEAISAASKEQATGISQVHLAIADIDRVTQENAALVEQTTAAAESLNDEANALRSNMSFFTTGQEVGHLASKRSAAVVTQPAVKRPIQALSAPKHDSASSHSSGDWSEF